jgi:hypothetical protein
MCRPDFGSINPNGSCRVWGQPRDARLVGAVLLAPTKSLRHNETLLVTVNQFRSKPQYPLLTDPRSVVQE